MVLYGIIWHCVELHCIVQLCSLNAVTNTHECEDTISGKIVVAELRSRKVRWWRWYVWFILIWWWIFWTSFKRWSKPQNTRQENLWPMQCHIVNPQKCQLQSSKLFGSFHWHWMKHNVYLVSSLLAILSLVQDWPILLSAFSAPTILLVRVVLTLQWWSIFSLERVVMEAGTGVY